MIDKSTVDEALWPEVSDLLWPKGRDYYLRLAEDWLADIKPKEFERAMRETGFFYTAVRLVADRHGLDKFLNQIPKRHRGYIWLRIESELQKDAQSWEKESSTDRQESCRAKLIAARLLAS